MATVSEARARRLGIAKPKKRYANYHAVDGQFVSLCICHGLGKPAAEFQFAAPRKWRFDWAWSDRKIALEIEGGAFGGHGHRSVGRFLADIEKYNEATIRSWRVFRVTTDQFNSGAALRLIARAMGKP